MKPFNRLFSKTQRSFSPPLKLFALGGLGEIGKNMYGIQFKDEIILIDAGLKFPNADLPGVDYIIPDFQYLIDNRHLIKGLFLTHGHEDHIGAIPYLLNSLQVPVYGGALTIGLVKAKLDEHGLTAAASLNVIHESDIYEFRHLSVEFFRTTHSIPDAYGIAISTPYGYVVHSGDFKFDLSPYNLPPDFHKIAAFGKRGVLALMSDSTNSEREGSTPSERVIGESIEDLFYKCVGRIMIATFASNVHRLQQVVDAAVACNRKIVILGRSMEKVFAIGQQLGYIHVPDGMLIDPDQMRRYDSNRIVIICTGSQGEPNAALTRIASGSHRWIHIHPGDNVIFSSSPIPGNSKNVHRSIDLLTRAGANVIHGTIFDIHTSGHGSQEDLKVMLQLTKPRYFIPIHGEYRMLIKHSRLAESTGIAPGNIFIMDLGQLLHLRPRKAKLQGHIPSGETYVSGNQVSVINSGVIQDRLQMRNNGIVIAVLTMNRETGAIMAGPAIICRGVVYVKEHSNLIASAEKYLKRALESRNNNLTKNDHALEQTIERHLTSYFIKELNRSPHILPIITRS